ncbi:hypothetical protein ACP70R_038055 [Stipagrostis hirtigluma subsp. patula]
MAPHNLAHLCVLFLLMSIATVTSAVPTSDDTSSLCAIPSPAPKHVPAGKDKALPLLRSFQLNAGYFFGGEEIHFTKDGDDGNVSYSYVTRSFSMLPHHVERTVDPSLLHVAATLTLTGGRARQTVLGGRRRRRHRFVDRHSVSFYLDGYYSVTSAELCMAGWGTYSEDDGSIEQLPGVVLRLRVPNPPRLSDPFVTGRLRGAGFRTISLVAYAEGDAYQYGHGDGAASCPPAPSSTARGALRALDGDDFSCARLKELLVNSYKLQHGFAASPLVGLDEPLMHVSQVRCAAGGAVRAYAAFYNDTAEVWRLQPPRAPFMVSQEVVVAEGRWDSARRMLCLRACRWVRSGTSVVAKECGIGMGFWFPGVWTIRDRSAVAGVLWNSSHAAGGNDGSGVISVSSIDDDINSHRRSNFSDVKYDYNQSMLEEAKKHYLKYKKTVKRSFLAPNYTDHDFEFRFFGSQGMVDGQGDAYPVAIGSAMVYGDRLAADESFARRGAVVDVKPHELLNVSYGIRLYVPPASWVRPTNVSSYSVPLEEHRITAEGVFDPKTGILCMVGCRELNGSTTDCEMLVTVQFASLEERSWGHGRGVIRSLRDKADHLFFNRTEIALYGMYTEQVSEAISRMDLESVLLEVSTTLPCVFTALQILHAKRRPEASAATSITMLVVLALGHVAALVVSSEALFLSRRMHYSVPFLRDAPYELSQAVLRAPTLIAFVLQLRLIQLAWSGRKSAAAAAAAERRALWVCLPLYLLGAASTVVAHVVGSRAAAGEDDYSLAVRVRPEPATLWEDLVSSAGLAQDAFLLPQVMMNAFSRPSSGAGVKAVSPWFYVGGTVVRAMPHVYDVARRLSYVPSLRPSYVYAGPRDDRFGVAWDVVVPCVAALLAVVVYLQQRRGGTVFLRSRRSGGYEMVSTI